MRMSHRPRCNPWGGVVVSGENHNQADPACRWYRPPTSRLARWWFDRQRGRSCFACTAQICPCSTPGYTHAAAEHFRGEVSA